MPTSDWPELAGEAQQRWNQNAAFWDDYMGAHSNDFHNLLVRPAMERLLAVQSGDRVLDIGCGNGNFSRYLAGLGARVTAIDGSDVMIERARQRTVERAEGCPENENAGSVDYQVIDVTDSERLEALGGDVFDAAVSNMAVMDMAVIGPMFEAVRGLLKPGGVFVCSLTHPCFQAPCAVRYAEQEDRDGEMIRKFGIKIERYLTPQPFKGLGIVGQPVPQYYFHRPLAVLLSACFEAGFVLDGLEERAFDESLEADRELSWANFRETPPMMAMRLRRLQ
ncbi:MAG: class I SAM-dependent methyltransferase [Gemmatimonadetes bacterium]|nr:class I SAM-dependent methyltransferase [Gemmatimonadota bacterium]